MSGRDLRLIGWAVLILTAWAAWTWSTRPAAGADAFELRGRSTVISDGDSFHLHTGVRIRLWGIDAPELRQSCPLPHGRSWPCGEFARERLREIIDRRALACERMGASYSRVVAQCWVWVAHRSRWLDVQAEMVVTGHALDDPRYSHGAYAAIEAEARALRRAIWAGYPEHQLVTPWIWRRTHAHE